MLAGVGPKIIINCEYKAWVALLMVCQTNIVTVKILEVSMFVDMAARKAPVRMELFTCFLSNIFTLVASSNPA